MRRAGVCRLIAVAGAVVLLGNPCMSSIVRPHWMVGPSLAAAPTRVQYRI